MYVCASPTGGGRSVGIVRSLTKATEFFFTYVRDFQPFSVRLLVAESIS